MPKFSIIIPVYNVEKYIKKCLDSVFSQTFDDYEVIVVNDGTKDNSMDIVKDYKVRVINQKNQGLSAARNAGVKDAKGEYLLFLDSDDYYEKDLLKELNKSLDNSPDVVRFQIQDVKNEKVIKEYHEKEFDNLNGVDAFNELVKYHYVENAWCYAIKRKYYEKEKYSFAIGKIHEDFGLVPLIIIKAKVVNSIPYIGYNYVQRESSIMSTNNYDKTKKKVDDFYYHYKFLINEIDKTDIDSKIFKSFISNSMILKICDLKGNDYKIMKKKLKEDKIYDNMITDSKVRKVKKTIVKISPKISSKLIK